MLLNHECPICHIMHEKESTPEPDQLCDTCKIRHESQYIIVRIIDHMQTPIHNREGEIEFFDDLETADLDRIYYQTDYTELLKVIKIN